MEYQITVKSVEQQSKAIDLNTLMKEGFEIDTFNTQIENTHTQEKILFVYKLLSMKGSGKY